LLQNEKEKSEDEVVYEHNLPGMPPSNFADVESYELRTYNRGAVLANIVERYHDQRINKIPAKDMTMCLREIDAYLLDIAGAEVADAKAAMVVHLTERGMLSENFTA